MGLVIHETPQTPRDFEFFGQLDDKSQKTSLL